MFAIALKEITLKRREEIQRKKVRHLHSTFYYFIVRSETVEVQPL